MIKAITNDATLKAKAEAYAKAETNFAVAAINKVNIDARKTALNDSATKDTTATFKKKINDVAETAY